MEEVERVDSTVVQESEVFLFAGGMLDETALTFESVVLSHERLIVFEGIKDKRVFEELSSHFSYSL